MSATLSKEKEVALQAVVAASRVCMRAQSNIEKQGTITKVDRTPVTVADYSSQAVVCRILKEAFSPDPIIAEETSELLGRAENARLLSRVTEAAKSVFPDATDDSVRQWIDLSTKDIAPRYWCLDPIDGTKGFLRGDQYAIALALVIEGMVRLGLLACPNLPEYFQTPGSSRGIVFVAVKGEGAFQMPFGSSKMVPIKVSSRERDEGVRFCESFEPSHSDHQLHEEIGRRLGIVESPIKMDSQAKYGIVARGDASIYLRLPSPKTPDYREKIWDHAAGTLLVQEAGGRVSDAFGKPLNYGISYKLVENRGVIATNGALHDQILFALSLIG
jgi:3'(2'), 5'-bisphosphate nucleotidase